MKNKTQNPLELEWRRMSLRYNAAIDQYQESDRQGKPDPEAMARMRDALIELARVAEWNRQVILATRKPC